MHKIMTVAAVSFFAFIGLCSLIVTVMLYAQSRAPYYSGHHWRHTMPPTQGVRVNTLLNAQGACAWLTDREYVISKDGPRIYVDGPIEYADKDWTLCGRGIVVRQVITGDRTVVTFRPLLKYTFLVRVLLTVLNSDAQERAQDWARNNQPEMLQ